MLPYRVLATLSDGEKAVIAALEQCWPEVTHQRCQARLLNNLAEPVMAFDAELRQQMRSDLGGLPSVPERTVREEGDIRTRHAVSVIDPVRSPPSSDRHN